MEEGGIGETIILCLIIYCLYVYGCSHDVEKVQPDRHTYPLLDNKAIMHQYKDNFDKLIFPKHSKKLTQYCSIHHDWEDIKAMWSKNGGDYYRWQYYVKKNKMSHKMRRR